MKEKNNFVLRCRLQSYDLNSLQNLNLSLKNIVSSKGFSFQSINLPIKLQKFTVLKSPHVNKKAKDQYEIELFNRLFIIKGHELTWEFLQELKENVNPNVSVKLSFVY